MRILLLIPFAALGACNVSTDQNNSAVTLQYNEEAAANAAADVGNTAENIGDAIANEANETANKVDNSDIVADRDNNSTDQNRQ